jgi:hypothetical protein
MGVPVPVMGEINDRVAAIAELSLDGMVVGESLVKVGTKPAVILLQDLAHRTPVVATGMSSSSLRDSRDGIARAARNCCIAESGSSTIA